MLLLIFTYYKLYSLDTSSVLILQKILDVFGNFIIINILVTVECVLKTCNKIVNTIKTKVNLL
jgi:hypothetical protein